MHNLAMVDYRKGALDYLRFVLEQTKLSPSALAERAGVSSTTLTRPLNDKHHKFTISTTTLAKIRDATGLDAGPFLSKDMDSVQRTLDSFVNEREYYADAPDDVGDFTGTPVIGEVAAGHWLEHRFLQDRLFGLFLVPSNPKQRNAFIGLIVRGESLNKIAQDGDILYTEVIAESGARWANDDLVVVERQREQGGLFEVSAKRVKILRNRTLLMPESTDPRFQEPLEIGEQDGQVVRVVGIVRYVIRIP